MSTSSVLNSLNYIDETITDSTIEVGNALFESYMKQAESAIIGNELGIIQEGFEYKEGENIFKTIFLYIPRLIVAFIKEIKRRWELYANNRRLEKLGKEIEKLSNELESYGIELKDIISKETRELGDVFVSEGTFHIRSKIKDIDKAITFFNEMINVFETYKRAAEEIKKNDGNFEDFFNAYNSATQTALTIKITDIVGTEKTTYDGREFPTKLKEMNKELNRCFNISEQSMKTVESWWADVKDNATSITDINSANRVLVDVREVRERFLKVYTELSSEYKTTADTYIKLKNILEKEKNEEQTKRKNELIAAHEETEKVANEKRAEKKDLENKIDELEKDSPLAPFMPFGDQKDDEN